MNMFKIHKEKPEGYLAYVEISVGFFHHRGKYLFLKRSELEEAPSTWGAPGGCIEAGEMPKEALIRESMEETGYKVAEDQAEFIKTFYIENNSDKKTGFFLHMFLIEVNEPFTPKLNLEHTNFEWLAWEEAEKLPLISGKGSAMQHYRAALEEKGFSAIKRL